MTSLLLHKMYKITSIWTAPPPYHSIDHYYIGILKPKTMANLMVVQAKRMGISERQHVPNFSVTEQLKMNKNTLFTHFVRTFTTCHLYIYTEYACAHTPV